MINEEVITILLKDDQKKLNRLIDSSNLELANSKGETILWQATNARSINCVKLLLEKGANVNTYDNDGWTPMHIAVQNNDIEMVELLMQYHPNINQQDKYGNNVIWTAVFNSRGEDYLIALLLKNGADPLVKNKSNISAIDLAKRIANYDNISVFKEFGIGV